MSSYFCRCWYVLKKSTTHQPQECRIKRKNFYPFLRHNKLRAGAGMRLRQSDNGFLCLAVTTAIDKNENYNNKANPGRLCCFMRMLKKL